MSKKMIKEINIARNKYLLFEKKDLAKRGMMIEQKRFWQGGSTEAERWSEYGKRLIRMLTDGIIYDSNNSSR